MDVFICKLYKCKSYVRFHLYTFIVNILHIILDLYPLLLSFIAFVSYFVPPYKVNEGITCVSPCTSSFVDLSSFFQFDLSLSLLSLRSTHPKAYLGKGVLKKICSEFTGERPCESVISIKLFCNFIEITLRQLVSPFNLLHIFRTLFPKDTSGRLLLKSDCGTTFTPKLNLVIIIFTILVRLLQQVYVVSFLMFQSLSLSLYLQL